MNRWLMAASVAAVLSVGTLNGLAQDNGGRPGRGNFDPAQFRERMMEMVKERLEVKEDEDWKAIQPLVQKVMDARMAAMGGMGRSMFGGRRGGDSNNNGDQQRRSPFGGQTMPEAEALQRAIDGKASNSEMKSAVAKLAEARKVKQAELERAQAELRKVLSVRQEAIATLNGWL
ncbi:MAG TPA: hypothetical protein VNT26_04740 [Candidatus Sulfotelmatobacter sp.]|nr:hypothetical protein [Candidatus Sulfotelmatobacter sp.]